MRFVPSRPHRLGLIPLSTCVFCWCSANALAQNQQIFPSQTVQLPSLGVSIDAQGVLTLASFDDTGELKRQRMAIAQRQLAQNIQAPSANRKISLRRVAETIEQQLAEGKPISEEIRCLAGLRRIENVFLLPTERDIVIAGPAGGWFQDPAGRLIGLNDGQSIVLLDDLLVALRAFDTDARLEKPVLCSIDPTAEGLERFQKLKRQLPSRFTDAEWQALPVTLTAALQESLGLANVRIVGVPVDSHIGQVMVESDYRMKMIGVGLEPEPVELTTFLEAIDGPVRGFQQWWLTPDYQWLMQDRDASAIQITGQGVQLITARLEVTEQHRLALAPERASGAAKKYAREFSKRYNEIATACPVFGQLQTVVDVLVVAAWLKHVEAWERTNWDGGVWFDETQLMPESLPVPTKAQCVASAAIKGNMLVTPVGGGFSVTPAIALQPENLSLDERDVLQAARENLQLPQATESWWWD